jgi:hypothetical protein
MCLRDTLLFQPDSIEESPALNLPWHELPFLPTTASDIIETPRENITPEEIATFYKGRYCPQARIG